MIDRTADQSADLQPWLSILRQDPSPSPAITAAAGAHQEEIDEGGGMLTARYIPEAQAGQRKQPVVPGNVQALAIATLLADAERPGPS